MAEILSATSGSCLTPPSSFASSRMRFIRLHVDVKRCDDPGIDACRSTGSFVLLPGELLPGLSAALQAQTADPHLAPQPSVDSVLPAFNQHRNPSFWGSSLPGQPPACSQWPFVDHGETFVGVHITLRGGNFGSNRYNCMACRRDWNMRSKQGFLHGLVTGHEACQSAL